MASASDILKTLLQSGNTVDPNQKVDDTPYLPTYTTTPDQQAQNQVDLQYNAQQRALQDAADEANRQTQLDVTSQQNYGKLVDPRLANVYSALGNTLTSDREATQGNYNTALDKIRGFYQQAGQSNQQLNTDLLAKIANQAQSLGLDAAVPGATQGINRDYAFAQQQGNQANADASANLTQLAAQIYGLDTGRVSSAAQEGAQERASAQQQVLKAISDLQLGNQKEQRGYRSQQAGLGQDKAIALRDAIDKITQQRSQDKISGHKSALDEFLQRSNLGLTQKSQQEALAQFLAGQDESRRQFDIGQAFNEKQLASQNANAAADRNAAAANARARSSGSGDDPLTQMLKAMQIQNYQSEIDKRGQKKLTGQDALNQLLNNPNEYWGVKSFGQYNPKAGPKFTQSVNDIINAAMTASMPQPKSRANPFGSTAQDPYKLAVSLAGTKAYKNMNQSALRSAIDAFFKGMTI